MLYSSFLGFEDTALAAGVVFPESAMAASSLLLTAQSGTALFSFQQIDDAP